MSSEPVRIEVPTSNGPLRASLAVPPRPMRLAELAHGFLDLSSRLIDIEAKHSERQGRAISCKKGCGACCRQLVPLSPPEAWLISELVSSFPSAKQAEVRQAFAKTLNAIAESNMSSVFDGGDLRAEDVMPTAVAYFHLGIPCPFLVDESCSIHPQRPSICREYLVTSPAENCMVIGLAPIERVPIHARISQALASVTARLLEKKVELVPLPLALHWAQENRDDGARTFDSRTMLTALAEELAKPIRSA